jgi:dolichol-phosphate mannosyltransferase
MYDLTVIIPTLNEAESIEETITKVDKELKSNNINGEILIVDDNSSLDNTIFILFGLEKKFPNISIIIRQRDHGLSKSLVEGFRNAQADIIQVIDADGQHPPKKIPELYQAILDGNDIAVASRYMGVEGSGVIGLPYHRVVLSWGATQLARIFFPAITDSGSGFFAFRKEVIKDAPLKPQGFRMLFEILGKGKWKKVKEIPYILGVRKEGTSKLSSRTVIAYLKQLWELLKYSVSTEESAGHKELKRVATFMLVGLSGVIVNLGTLYLITEWLDVFYIWSGLVGAEASILSNFILNDLITFRDITRKRFSLAKRLVSYHSITIIGTVISVTILYMLTEWLGFWYIVSGFIGLMAAFIWNFSINRISTWSGE